jgi:hypothetical protein
MTWLTWRQSRTELIIGGAIVMLLSVFLFWNGLDLHSSYDSLGIANCLVQTEAAPNQACQGAMSEFFDNFSFVDGLTFWLTSVPLLIGLLLAAPLVMDIEQGTSRLAWTQNVTRMRWLTTRIALGLLLAIAASALVMALWIWLFRPFSLIRNRFDQQYFDNEGAVVIAYSVFAFSLFLAAGTVLRRVAPAFGIALVGFVGVRVLVAEKLREHYLAPHKLIEEPFAAQPPQFENGTWIVNSGLSDRFGHIFAYNNSTLEECYSMGGPVGPGSTDAEWAAALEAQKQCFLDNNIHYTTLYHPADRFWIFQGIESAIFVGLSAVLLGITFYWVMRRIAR